MFFTILFSMIVSLLCWNTFFSHLPEKKKKKNPQDQRLWHVEYQSHSDGFKIKFRHWPAKLRYHKQINQKAKTKVREIHGPMHALHCWQEWQIWSLWSQVKEPPLPKTKYIPLCNLLLLTTGINAYKRQTPSASYCVTQNEIFTWQTMYPTRKHCPGRLLPSLFHLQSTVTSKIYRECRMKQDPHEK